MRETGWSVSKEESRCKRRDGTALWTIAYGVKCKCGGGAMRFRKTKQKQKSNAGG